MSTSLPRTSRRVTTPAYFSKGSHARRVKLLSGVGLAVAVGNTRPAADDGHSSRQASIISPTDCGIKIVRRPGRNFTGPIRPCAQKGKSACKGRSVPMDKLDTIVTEPIADQLLTPQRVEELLTGLIELQASRSADYTDRITSLRKTSAIQKRA